MRFLRNFDFEIQYDELIESDEYGLPNVSNIKENDDVQFNNYEAMPLTFQIVGNEEQTEGNIYLNFDGEDSSYVVTLLYRINEGEWEEGTFGETEIAVEAGDIVQFKCNEETAYGEGNESSFNNYNYFYCDINFNIFGNLNSLNNFNDEISNCQYSFLFFNNDLLLSAKHLVLPSMVLKKFCYSNMFNGCTSLTLAPELPATTLDDYCYSEMFEGCTGLTSAPELPATTLAEGCYGAMFAGCTSLTSAPELSATTLANYCYSSMFVFCTGLETAPELPATTLANNCYYNMFQGCTSLTSAPELPATTLANYCYSWMFSNCTSMTTAPSILPATTLAEGCYGAMFAGCTSLTSAPELPATTLAESCYSSMFYDCTSLNYIKCLATDISATNCTYLWAQGVASTGTFVKNASMSGWSTGASGIPLGWNVENSQ